MESEPIKFYQEHGENVRLSAGDQISKMFIDFPRTLCITDRPVARGEKLILSNINENLFSMMRFGFTQKDPRSIKGFADANEEVWECSFTQAWFKERIVMCIEIATNLVSVKVDDYDAGKFDVGLKTETPVYLVLYHLTTESSMRISSGTDLKSRKGTDDIFWAEKSEAFQGFELEPARFIASPEPTSVKLRANVAVSHNLETSRGNFVYIFSPLKPGRALVVELTALKRSKPVRVVLTAKDARRVYSCGSLPELCNTTYSLMMESELPEAGVELAVRISLSGAVYISHNNRGWIQKLRVDADLTYNVVIDMQHLSVLSILGVATDLCDPDENEIVVPDAVELDATLNVVPLECVICLENTRNAVVIPCYHVALCDSCADSLQKSTDRKCPICRKIVTGSRKLYYA